MQLRYFFALLIGKLVIRFLQLKGSRATALPGLIAEKICPNFIELSRGKLGKVIAITGTNGKTSTQTLLSHTLRALTKQRIMVNSRGANLKRGLISELLKELNLFDGRGFNFSIFEVEEATLPKITRELTPDYLIVTNFFRDQLDAYGEIERTKNHVANAVSMLSKDSVLIANSDDPQVLDTIRMSDSLGLKKVYVSISGHEKFISYESLQQKLGGEEISKGENGTQVSTNIYPEAQIDGDLGLSFILDKQEFKLLLPGYYSNYSFAFTHALLTSLRQKGLVEFNSPQLASTVEECKPAFGRGEIIKLNKDRSVRILLIKNPVGFNLALDLLKLIKSSFSLSILINDKIADGRDVSWLWDSEIEMVNDLNLTRILCSGERSKDMRLRLKYALAGSDHKIKIHEAEDINKLIDLQMSGSEQEIVLATYTAMNSYRDKLLARVRQKR